MLELSELFRKLDGAVLRFVGIISRRYCHNFFESPLRSSTQVYSHGRTGRKKLGGQK